MNSFKAKPRNDPLYISLILISPFKALITAALGSNEYLPSKRVKKFVLSRVGKFRGSVINSSSLTVDWVAL